MAGVGRQGNVRGGAEAGHGQASTITGTTFQSFLVLRVSDVAVFNILRPDPRNIELFRRYLGR